jgi:hypothetical protein
MTARSTHLTEFHQYEPQAAKQIGRYLYCHHCKQMHRMKLLGYDNFNKTVFRCRNDATHTIRLAWVREP